MTDIELLDKALGILEDMEFDIPCDQMFGYGWCEDKCKFDHPTKECWRMYISGEYENLNHEGQ